jgi:hypothetical protein
VSVLRRYGFSPQYLEHHNADPKPFIWTKSAGEILEKVAPRETSVRVTTLALLWQIIAIDRRNWIPESDFQ